MKAPVASSSIWVRSMAVRLNSQSNSLSGLRSREACVADAMSDAAFAALVGLLGDEQVQELLVRQAVAPGARQDGVELFGAGGP